MTTEIPSIASQILDRKTQNARLIAFLRAHPHTIYSQETLAEMAGCHLGSIRTRISNIQGELHLVWHQTGYLGSDGQKHISPKQWEHVPRPVNALGPDASSPRELRLPL
jgi:hypothetical protein